jgi:hypothetical protein
MPDWVRKKILIVVKTYPTPAWKGVEVSCTAGITDDNKWIRIFPVPYRLLEGERQFKKYQWIEANVRKASDPRPESYNIDISSLEILSPPLPSINNWDARKKVIFPLLSSSLCSLKKQRDADGIPTLGIFKPKSIHGFSIRACDGTWSPEQSAKLKQTSLFTTASYQELEKIPYNFSYRFTCSDRECSGHDLICTDWEMSQSYRRWLRSYQGNWRRYFTDKYETEMILGKDLHFYVGTMHEYPGTWIITGLFYPPK